MATPAKPNEAITFYLNGFGQTVPAIVDGSASQAGALRVNPVIKIGGIPAQVQFAGVVSAGLYQFNVTVPAAVADGDNVLTVDYDGFTTQSGVYLTVQR